MSASRRLATLAVLVVVSGASAGAHAQPSKPAAPSPSPSHKPPPSPQELAQARAHFRNAEAAKARGEYQTAAVEYLAAYELFEEPEFFFDTAEVYRLAGDDPDALTYYEKYLELDPTGRGVAIAKAASTELRRAIAAKADAAADAARRADADAEARRKADEQRRKEAADAARRAAEAQRDPAAAPAESPAASSGRGLRLAGLATGGAGVVALGVSVVFGVRARSIGNETASWQVFDPKRYDQGKAAERDMYIFGGVGAAALLAGGALYYLGHQAGESSSAPDVTFAPVLGPSQVTFTAAGRF